MNEVTTRRIDRKEVELLADLCFREGFNLSLQYLQCCYDVDPQGWWAAVLGDRIVGFCCCAQYPDDDERARLAAFIVEKPYRNQGIGRKVFRACLEGMHTRNVILTAFNLSLYENKSFQCSLALGQWGLKREGFCPPTDDSPAIRIVPLDDIPFPKLEAYDKEVTPWNSKIFLNKVILKSASSGIVAVDNTTDDVVGYGCLRKGPVAWTIQPLYASSRVVAIELLKSLLAGVKGEENVEVYPCADNEDAVALLKECGFVPDDKPQYVMVTHEHPITSVDKVYSLACKAFTTV